MKTLLLAVIILLHPYFARANTDTLEVSNFKPFPENCPNPVPSVSGWEVVGKQRIEFRLSDETVAYLGLDIEYFVFRNPDSGESMQVISRHRPRIFARPKLEDNRRFAQVAASLYADKDEQEMFVELEKELDPILYIYWRTGKNQVTGKNAKDGDANIWFMPSDGSCLFTQNKKIGVQFLSENVGNGKLRNIFVGVKYQIGDVYHILKVNRRDVLTLMNRKEEHR